MQRRTGFSAHRPLSHTLATCVLVGVVALTGCASGAAPGSGSNPVSVDTNPDKPFVLGGVRRVTEVAKLTGPNAINDTMSVGVAGTDLGSMTTIGDRTYFFFGDTFGERAPDAVGGQGGMWRSNVSAWSTDADPTDGITFDGWAPVDGIGLASALVEGDHGPNDGSGEVTKIPTYGFAIDETLYVQYMSVSFWGTPGEWDASYAGLAKSSDEGRTWTALDAPKWPGDSNFVQVATAHVQEGGEEFVYFWAIPAGRFGEVQLMRVPATERAVEDIDAYTYFQGTDAAGSPRWGREMDEAATVLEGTIGELSVIWSTYLDRWIMTYSDGGSAYLREGITPWGPWGEPVEIASQVDFPGLYAPFLEPRYVQEEGRVLYFSMSLWDPYNVFWFSMELERVD